MKNKILKASVILAVIIFIVAACAADGSSYTPAVVMIVSLIYIILFCKVNRDYLIKKGILLI